MQEIIAELHRRRVQLDAVDGKLRFRPAGAVDGPLRDAMKQREPELVEIVLSGEPELQVAWLMAVESVHSSGAFSDEVAEQFRRAEVIWGEAGKMPAPPPGRTGDWCSKCGSADWRDTRLEYEPHRGKSSRRDCSRCGAFKDFPRWYEPD
ncbi:TubC N-terminal docking domain-related protein [Posidoniimonas polymericola]|uniref:TubC N-terminal docking domain-related protein n=1 Tax=Posidoniimonas polymericola TaxID=2528002 RepID=UPI0018D49829